MTSSSSRGFDLRTPTNIPAILLIPVFASLLLIGGALYSGFQDELANTRLETKNLALAVEQYTLSVLHQSEELSLDVVELLAEHPSLNTGAGHYSRSLSLAIKQLSDRIPAIDLIAITDAQGNHIANSEAFSDDLKTYTERHINVSDRDYFKKHVAHPDFQVFYSEPIRSRTTQNMIIMVTRKVPAPAGQFRGLILVGINLKIFSEFYASIRPGSEGSVRLWTLDRILLASGPYEEPLIGNHIPISPEQRLLLVDQNQTLGHYTISSTVDQIRRIYTFKRLENLPFVITVGKSLNETLHAWRLQFIVYFSLLAMIMAWTIWGLYRYSRGLMEIEKQRMLAIQATKMSALGEMAGSIAHEINNPLAVISGRAKQLIELYDQEQVPDRDDVLRIAHRIDYTALRIARIVRGLRSFARNSDEDPKVNCSLQQIVDNTLEISGERFKFAGVTLEVGNLPNAQIKCREAQISQVLLNLLNNALDAVRDLPERWVKVEATLQEGYIALSVTDSGHGIPTEIADKIMQPFFTTKPVGQGTGLGLSISKGIIEEHGGTLFLDRHSRHTRFVLTLPTQS